MTAKAKRRLRNSIIADPAWVFAAEPVLRLTEDEASLLAMILVPLLDRAHKYMDSGALTGRDAEVLEGIAERLEDTQPRELHEGEEELVRRILAAEDWPALLGLDGDELSTYAELHMKLKFL